MKKLTIKQLKSIIEEALNEETPAMQGNRGKAQPPPVPDAAKKQQGSSGPSEKTQQYVGLVKQASEHLGEILREIDSGSGDAGMSAYYIGQELEKVMKTLTKPMIFFKKNGQG